MAKKQTIKMPLEYVKKTLTYLDLAHIEIDLSDGNGVQIRLTKDGYDHVNVNAYNSGTVVAQPYGDPSADLVSQILALRAARLRRKGEIPQNL